MPVLLGLAGPILASDLARRQAGSLESCPGYAASNVKDEGSRLTADLSLAGDACNAYGEDLTSLKLEVEYQTGRSALRFQRIAAHGENRKSVARQDLRC